MLKAFNLPPALADEAPRPPGPELNDCVPAFAAESEFCTFWNYR